MDMVKFTPQQLRELQLKELETLVYFKNFCDENNLLFYFCGGCCIGSLRNKGFIPWDDDIDVFMPREDYEKLPELWEKYSENKRFLCLKTNDKIFTGNIFTTIVDTSGTCVKANQVNIDVPHGLVMDVFPLDGCPDGFKRKMQKMWAMIYSLFLAQIVPENHGKLLAFGSKILLGICSGKKLRSKIWHFAERHMTKYPLEECTKITELCAGPHYMQCEYPKEAFESAVYKEFEGLQMPIPVGYDIYLKTAFGDYMKVPPKEKQQPHHDVVYCDIKKSCYDFENKFFSEK